MNLFFFFKPSAGRVSVLCLSFIDWSENLPAADFRCINRVYRVSLLSALWAAVSWNIDTCKTLFSIREASVNLLTGSLRVQLGNIYISDTILMSVYIWCLDLIQCCVTAEWCHFLTTRSEKQWNRSQYRYGGTRSEILGCFVVQSERLIIYWIKKLQSVKPKGGASDEAFRSSVLCGREELLLVHKNLWNTEGEKQPEHIARTPSVTWLMNYFLCKFSCVSCK